MVAGWQKPEQNSQLAAACPEKFGKPVGRSPEGNVSYSFRTECQCAEQFKQQQEKPGKIILSICYRRRRKTLEIKSQRPSLGPKYPPQPASSIRCVCNLDGDRDHGHR
ncbi:hypothetical protein T07_8871 [Trichinella nelsoni]|uniref:Uncharacterized protein n=1 Tax=Trichinella nelsoni TaxID=6336 RepID=A0A0V0RU72_9BILA|nr:hypothetical protein T07_8871 [Trichinella nelsoni]KRX61516.1 hypothetical protein T09_4748 [Trichinella sp. T9]